MKTETIQPMFRRIFFSLLILSAPLPLQAQSPYALSWKTDGYLLGIGGMTAGTGFFMYRSVSSPTLADLQRQSSASIPQLDRSALYHYSEQANKTSDLLYVVLAASPCVLFTENTIQNDWKTIVIMYVETWLFTGGVSGMSKGSIVRYRPYIYNPEAPMGKKMLSDAKMSFFSNHTASAFSSAVFLSTVYGAYYPESHWKPYIWGGSLLLAGITGYLRYEAGMHFPTDIIAGAIVGSAIGYGIPWIHRIKNEDISLLPYSPNAEYGISLRVRF